MTCIVGLVEQGTVYVGADSAGVSGLDIRVRADPKVFRVGSYLIGYTTSFRMGQLLRFGFAPPEQDPRHSDDEHMMTVFVDAVRERFKGGGYATVNNNVETGGTFLIGYRGRLYIVQQDYQVGVPVLPYDAVGCGADMALGALYATEGGRPRDRVLLALQAAEQFSGGVRRPFVIEEVR